MLASNVVCATQRTAKLDEAEVSGAFLDEETGLVDEYSDEELEIIEQCRKQTVRHIGEVNRIIHWFAEKLIRRGIAHDKSKLQMPELAGFALNGTRLSDLEYGSDEYHQNLKRLNGTLKHHYAMNRHHPEHFANGVSGMTLMEVSEMFCDWLAATRLNKNGDIYRSIEICAERFHLDPQLKQILINTAYEFEKSTRL